MKTTITQKAEEVGISQGFLSNILACRRNPIWSVALKLAKAFNTEPSFWMKGESTSRERWEVFNKIKTPEKINAALKNKGTNQKTIRKVLKKEGSLPCAQ